MLRPQQQLLGRFVPASVCSVHFAVRHAAVPPQKIDGRVGGDARKPVRRLLFVLELLLPLQRLDEGFLGEILGVGHVAHDAVNLHEDAPQIVGDKTVLSLHGLEWRGQPIRS